MPSFGLRKFDHVSEFRNKWLPIRHRKNTHMNYLLHKYLILPFHPSLPQGAVLCVLTSSFIVLVNSSLSQGCLEENTLSDCPLYFRTFFLFLK